MMTYIMYGALVLIILISGWAAYIILTLPKKSRKKKILPEIDRHWRDYPDSIQKEFPARSTEAEHPSTSLNLNQLWQHNSQTSNTN